MENNNHLEPSGTKPNNTKKPGTSTSNTLILILKITAIIGGIVGGFILFAIIAFFVSCFAM